MTPTSPRTNPTVRSSRSQRSPDGSPSSSCNLSTSVRGTNKVERPRKPSHETVRGQCAAASGNRAVRIRLSPPTKPPELTPMAAAALLRLILTVAKRTAIQRLQATVSTKRRMLIVPRIRKEQNDNTIRFQRRRLAGSVPVICSRVPHDAAGI